MSKLRGDDEAVKPGAPLGFLGRVLLINTCGMEGVVAVAAEGGVLGVEGLPGRGTSESLVPAVRRLMEGVGWRVRELAAVGVVVGPGSFTGIRVGLSAAKGLCEAGEVGMVSMSRLALVAGEEGVALLDAGRGEFFLGEYRSGAMVREGLIGAEEARGLVEGGAAAVTCEERVVAALGTGVRLVREPGAEEMLAMVTRRVGGGVWSDVATADANYLRRTDAELKVRAG